MAPISDSDLLWSPGTVRLEGKYITLFFPVIYTRLRSTKLRELQSAIGSPTKIEESFSNDSTDLQQPGAEDAVILQPQPSRDPNDPLVRTLKGQDMPRQL